MTLERTFARRATDAASLFVGQIERRENVGGVAGNLAGRLPTFEGEAPKRVTIQVWDSLERVKAWRDSKEFADVRKVGEKYATFNHAFAVEGVPQ